MPLNLTAVQRELFWPKVRIGKPNECWEWTAARSPKGYGWFGTAGRSQHAHRVAYTIAVGDIPEGVCVCHHCDNPPCCNPAHLWLGTTADNTADMVRKGRNYVPPRGQATHTPEQRARGEDFSFSKLTEELVREIREKKAAGRLNILQESRRLGIGRTAIREAARRRTWRHVCP